MVGVVGQASLQKIHGKGSDEGEGVAVRLEDAACEEAEEQNKAKRHSQKNSHKGNEVT